MTPERCPQPSPPHPPLHLPRRERAQATIEFVGSLPLLALGAAACLQAMLVAVSLVFAQVAADRAARGVTAAEATESLPLPWRQRTRVRVADGRAVVRVSPPAVLPGAGRLTVSASSEKLG